MNAKLVDCINSRFVPIKMNQPWKVIQFGIISLYLIMLDFQYNSHNISLIKNKKRSFISEPGFRNMFMKVGGPVDAGKHLAFPSLFKSS